MKKVSKVGIWKIVSFILRLILGFVFITAGWAKIGDPQTFVRAVRAYQMLPEWGVYLFGYGLAPLEIILGIMIILGFATKLVGISLASLLVTFNIAIASVWARGISVECGCFGGGGSVTGEFDATAQYLPHIATNIGYLIAAVILAFSPYFIKNFISVDGLINRITNKKEENI